MRHDLLGPQDSTGNPIQIGDKVLFRGRIFTIKTFVPGEGRMDTARIMFEEPQHTTEPADEISVDFVVREAYT